MKNFIKKISVAVCAVSISALFSVACINASETPRPMPAGGNSATTQNVSTSTGSQADTTVKTSEKGKTTVNNQVPNTVTQTTTSNVSNKKYLSRMGGFLWFLLSVIVNFVVSCWVANKFYQLTKKNTQGSSEIRALRKDIEEKFASTLKDISEPAVEIMNSNENYARTEEGVAMPERKPRVEMNEQEREIVNRWDIRRSMSRDEEIPQQDEEEYEDEDYRPQRENREEEPAFRPSRRMGGIEFEDEDEEEYEEYEERRNRSPRMRENNPREGRRTKKSFSVNKAKNILGSFFPFDE